MGWVTVRLSVRWGLFWKAAVIVSRREEEKEEGESDKGCGLGPIRYSASYMGFRGNERQAWDTESLGDCNEWLDYDLD